MHVVLFPVERLPLGSHSASVGTHLRDLGYSERRVVVGWQEWGWVLHYLAFLIQLSLLGAK